MNIARFRRLVWSYYKNHGRHDLPWRKTHDLYRVLVSEVMLQQTQVDRVVPFYKEFIKKFPTAVKLAKAPLADVLKAWQGLGYNRRAKMLKEAAAELTTRKVHTVAELEMLPGVGPYTARAVAAFSQNEDVLFVETNIRTAIIHHFFTLRAAGTFSSRSAPATRPILHPGKNVPAARVSDAEILEVLKKLLPKGRAREWYSALMDYGAHLKRSGISHNARSSTYAKQAKFSGSLREARGAVIRVLAQGGKSEAALVAFLGPGREAQVRQALVVLCKAGLIQKRGRAYALPR